jgi:hypothetical protein
MLMLHRATADAPERDDHRLSGGAIIAPAGTAPVPVGAIGPYEARHGGTAGTTGE